MDLLVDIRNMITGFLYKMVLKPIFFAIDPEEVHDRMIGVGKFLGRHAITRWKTRILFFYANKKLEQEILGIKFTNPIGLAAGFDKNAELSDILPSVGFGFMEVGSITGEPCEGNPKPRLWRMPEARALQVNYGLKNDGCEVIGARLRDKKFNIPVGISVAKTNCQATADREQGIRDYVKAYRALAEIGAYTTINISCPNAYGGQPFHHPEDLDALLREIDSVQTKKPVFLKISPDLSFDQVDAIIDVARVHRVDGFICANLTKRADGPGSGGVSGKLVEDLSTDLVRHVYQKAGNQFVMIGCGGVFSAEDAYKKIKAGAALIQLITGMIYQGPQLISEINHGLVGLLEKDGFQNISEAVGVDNRAHL